VSQAAGTTLVAEDESLDDTLLAVVSNGRQPGFAVPSTFDGPLPDAEIARWEGNS
jgi:hypothetical protein